MTKRVRKTSSNITFKNQKENKLSIQFNLDGFSFSIHDTTSKKDVYFCEYLFDEKQTTPENLLQKIEEIFKTDDYLQQDFLKVNVIHQNQLFTLVPNTYFDENKLESYLNFNIKTFATDFIAVDELKSIEAKNVYVPYVNINNYLFQNFGEFDYKHHLTILIEKLLKESKTIQKTMFINVGISTLDIIVLEKNKLQLANSFLYNTKEDFIYYILFVTEQLKLDPEKFTLYLIGKITTDSEIYKITYQYIRNIYFLESDNVIFNHLDAPKHFNFTLLES